MKTRNQLKLLPEADRQRILELCAELPYEEVAELLALPPSQGGLQIQTSKSALCRYYTDCNQHARKTIVLKQNAQSLQVHRQSACGAFPTAILTLLETRIFEALSNGASVTELKDDFAALKDFHRGFLAEEKWRRAENAKPEQEASLHRLNTGSHYDFIPLDHQGRPAEPPPMSPEQILALQELQEQEEEDSDEISEKDLQELDDTIATEGEQSDTLMFYPRQLVKERARLHRQRLKARGITALQAALEIHNRKHGFAPDGTPLPSQKPAPAPAGATPGEDVPAPNLRPFQPSRSAPKNSTRNATPSRQIPLNSTSTPRHST